MTNIIVEIPTEIENKMKSYPNIKWNEVARQAIMAYLEKLSIVDRLSEDSILTEEQAAEIGEIVKAKAWENLQNSLSEKT